MATTQVTIGDTVWLKGEFKNRTGTYTDPTGTVYIKVYTEGEVLLTTLTATQTATGKYERDYLIPAGYDNLIFEFTGTVDGYTETKRDTLNCVFRESPI